MPRCRAKDVESRCPRRRAGVSLRYSAGWRVEWVEDSPGSVSWGLGRGRAIFGGKWAAGLRWIVRRARPSRRQAGNLTAFEKKTGWRYSITCTSIPPAGIPGVPGSHHPQFIDVLHRQHAVVEDGVRNGKAMGLRNLPSKSWQVNCGWVLAASIAADLAAWTRLIGLHDQEGLKDAEPQTLRYRLWHMPARLSTHARQRTLKISPTWPWKDAFLTCWQRLSTLPAPA
jgi:hypothetical protein